MPGLCVRVCIMCDVCVCVICVVCACYICVLYVEQRLSVKYVSISAFVSM